MAEDRKPLKVYKPPTGRYIHERVARRSDRDNPIRSKKVDGHVIRFEITDRKGPRGGRTRLLSVLHPEGEKDAPRPRRAAGGSVVAPDGLLKNAAQSGYQALLKALRR